MADTEQEEPSDGSAFGTDSEQRRLRRAEGQRARALTSSMRGRSEAGDMPAQDRPSTIPHPMQPAAPAPSRPASAAQPAGTGGVRGGSIGGSMRGGQAPIGSVISLDLVARDPTTAVVRSQPSQQSQQQRQSQEPQHSYIFESDRNSDPTFKGDLPKFGPELNIVAHTKWFMTYQAVLAKNSVAARRADKLWYMLPPCFLNNSELRWVVDVFFLAHQGDPPTDEHVQALLQLVESTANIVKPHHTTRLLECVQTDKMDC